MTSVFSQTLQIVLNTYLRLVPGVGTKIRARYLYFLTPFHFKFSYQISEKQFLSKIHFSGLGPQNLIPGTRPSPIFFYGPSGTVESQVRVRLPKMLTEVNIMHINTKIHQMFHIIHIF